MIPLLFQDIHEDAAHQPHQLGILVDLSEHPVGFEDIHWQSLPEKSKNAHYRNPK